MHAKKLHHFYMHFTFGKHYSDVIFNSQHALVHKLTCIFSILVMHQSFVIIINMQHIVSGPQHNSDDHSKWFIETRDFNVCFNMSLILFKWWYLTVCQLLISSLISLRHTCDRLVSNGPCSCELQDAFCACEEKVAIFSTFAMPQARENIKALIRQNGSKRRRITMLGNLGSQPQNESVTDGSGVFFTYISV